MSSPTNAGNSQRHPCASDMSGAECMKKLTDLRGFQTVAVKIRASD
ncbi:hypothetical protein NON20_16530 [Synechocystis sp. B12]|nr:hypothetical protein NON20_16530 [Synechocystis sp. B12]